MLATKKNTAHLGFFFTFRDQLDQKHPLFLLADQIDWQRFEDAFAPLYLSLIHIFIGWKYQIDYTLKISLLR